MACRNFPGSPGGNWLAVMPFSPPNLDLLKLSVRPPPAAFFPGPLERCCPPLPEPISWAGTLPTYSRGRGPESARFRSTSVLAVTLT